MPFTEKVVLVTGASSGIGAETVIQFSKQGASVVVVDRDEHNLCKVADKIRKSGAAEPLEIVADVTKDTERIITETIQKFGKLDILINNAGIFRLNEETTLGSLEIYDKIMSVNVRSVIALTKLAVPHLEKTKGNIVNLSSITATMASASHTAYSMSKAAIDHFTRCAAVELAPKGIRVNAVRPGVIRTLIYKNSGANGEMVDRIFTNWAKIKPLGRIGEVQDVANAILFLANDNASFITGHSMYCDGGSNLVR